VSELARIPAASVPSGAAVRIDPVPGSAAGAVCVVRIGDDFWALGDRCSHANVSLSEGDVDTEERTIECWKHGSAFSLADGSPQSLPAIAPVPVYTVTRDGDDVVVSS
jgi:3-phenylpropionate/trans-cinnamate dioxygenase ferredoxin subunit